MTFDPSKWQLVPKEPDETMIAAGASWTDYQPEDDDGQAPNADAHCAKRVYKAMLAVAPQAPVVAGDVIERAVKALLDYEQADEDGVMVLASRQAIHEVVAAIRALKSKPAIPRAPAVSGDGWMTDLRKVLEPFAKMASEYDYEPVETQEGVCIAVVHSSDKPNVKITVGDLRRARDWLARHFSLEGTPDKEIVEALEPFANFCEKAEAFVDARAMDGGSPILPVNDFRLSDFRRARAALLKLRGRV